MQNIEVEIKWKELKQFFLILVSFSMILTFFNFSNLDVKAKEKEEVNEEAVYSGSASQWWETATSDAKKVNFQSSTINVKVNQGVRLSSIVNATPKVPGTIASTHNVKYRVGNTQIAQIEDSPYGDGKFLMPKKIGNTYLYAKVNGVEVKTLLKVSKEEINDYFHLHQEKLNIGKGQSLNIKEYITYTRYITGGDAVKNIKYTYKLGNSKIASVTSNGDIKGLSKGNTYLYITSPGGIENRIMICVTDSNKPKTVAIQSGQTFLKGFPKKINFSTNPKNVSEADISWKTGNSSIATITNGGIVKGIKKGKTNAIAYVSGKEVAKSVIQVISDNDPAYLIPDSDEFEIVGKNNERQIGIHMFDSEYNPVYDTPIKASVGNANIAKIKENRGYGNFIIESKNYGNTWLNLETENGLKARVLIKVVAKPKDDFKFSVKELDMKVGDQNSTHNLMEYNLFEKYTINFKTGNTSIAKVENDIIKAVKPGKTYLYANCEGQEIRILVNVKPVDKITSLKFDVGERFTLDASKEDYKQINLIVNPSKADEDKVTFTVGNPSIARVSQSGYVQGLKNGKTYIYATTTSGVQAKTLVEVKGLAEISLINLPSTINVEIDSTEPNYRTGGHLDLQFKKNTTANYSNGSITVKVGNPNIIGRYTLGYYGGNSTNELVRDTLSLDFEVKTTGNTYLYIYQDGKQLGKVLVKVTYGKKAKYEAKTTEQQVKKEVLIPEIEKSQKNDLTEKEDLKNKNDADEPKDIQENGNEIEKNDETTENEKTH